MKEINDEGWWCPNCEEMLSSERVTYGERCDTCGHGVIWIDGTLRILEPDELAVKRVDIAESYKSEALKRHKELALEQWEWSSFYNGWLECIAYLLSLQEQSDVFKARDKEGKG